MSFTEMLDHWFGEHPTSDAGLSSRENAAADVTAGDFRLDLQSRSAYLHAQKLSLTSAEFDLLRFLLTHRKMLVTPNTMLSTASDAPTARRTRFMHDLISLKKKLDEAAGQNRYLHLEPWVLYEFELKSS
jgi:DNA-binding response OmpR family regulator